MKSLIIIAVICAVAYANPLGMGWLGSNNMGGKAEYEDYGMGRSSVIWAVAHARQGGQLRQDRQQAPARNINITGMQKNVVAEALGAIQKS